VRGLPQGVLFLTDAHLRRAKRAVSTWLFRERRVRAGRAVAGFDANNARRLVRSLRLADVCPTGPVLWDGLLRRACGWAGIDPGRLWRFVADADRTCRVKPGGDAYAAAGKLADRDAAHFARLGHRDRVARAAALAMWLGFFAGERAGRFAFGSARLAAYLGCHRNTADKVVRELEAAGLVAVRKDAAGRTSWSYKAGDARECTYTGPDFITGGAEHGCGAVQDQGGDAVPGAEEGRDRLAGLPDDEGTGVRHPRRHGQRRAVDVRTRRLGTGGQPAAREGPRPPTGPAAATVHDVQQVDPGAERPRGEQAA
jgi:hypothetical protein